MQLQRKHHDLRKSSLLLSSRHRTGVLYQGSPGDLVKLSVFVPGYS